MSSLSQSISTALRPWIDLSRVSRFAGTMLIFWPFAWSLTMCAYTLSMPLATYTFYMLYGLVGTSLLHSAGCVWNDILDRDFDRQVERTKRRPIADGRVSVPGALVFLSGHLIALVAMMRPFRSLAWQLGLLTVFPLPGIYPLMKRVTYWPQAWLGIAMNMVVFVVWTALRSVVSRSAIVLLAGCWSWTLYYDTIYACQDKKDDVKAGVKSTALLFGSRIRFILAGFAALMVLSLVVAGVLNSQGLPFHVLSIGGAVLHMARQIKSVNLDDTRSCLVAFESNAFNFGAIVWGGLVADYLLS